VALGMAYPMTVQKRTLRGSPLEKRIEYFSVFSIYEARNAQISERGGEDGCPVFREEHEIFRKSLRSFLEKEVKPHQDEWRKSRQVPREIWRKMGEQGFIGTGWTRNTGRGGGFRLFRRADRRVQPRRCPGFSAGLGVHNDIVMPYIEMLGTEEQKVRWLPKCCTASASWPSA